MQSPVQGSQAKCRRLQTLCSWVVQLVRHAPALQVKFGHAPPWVQSCPQLPQLAGSVLVLVQVPEQAISPEGQAQTPDTHEIPFGQTWPQDPQLFGSEVVFTQLPLQQVTEHVVELH